MNELPMGWVRTEIVTLCELINGRAFKPQEWSESGLPIIRIQNLNNREAKFNHYSGSLDEKHHVRPGDLLFAWSGTPGTSFGAHIWHGGDAALNQHIFKIGFSEVEIDRSFLRYAINQKLEELIGSAQGGVGLRHITKGTFEKTVISYPPRNEQTRIAQKINELLAQIDTLKARIDAVPALLQRFRQSLLTAAISGKLTKEWRHSHGVPTPAKKSIGEMAELVTKGASPKWQGVNYVEDRTQTLFVTSENVRSMHLDITKEKYIEDKFNTLQPRSILADGDVLTNIVGASIGRAAVWRHDRKANINQAVCIVRPRQDKLDSDYLCLYLNSPEGIAGLAGEAVDVARANVSLAAIKGIKLSMPDVLEQKEIVRRVNLLLAFTDQLETKVASAKKSINHLTQSILAKAFRGELVPQDPSDEPASVLLERIKAQRAAPPEAKRGRKATA